MSKTYAEVPVLDGTLPNYFDRVVALVNSHSTQAEWAHDYVSELSDSQYTGSRFVEVMTRKEKSATQDELASTLKAGDVLVVVGGDKTAAEAAEVMIKPEIAALGIAMTDVHAGNASDGASMLNGRQGEYSLLSIIEFGKLVRVFPMQRETKPPGGEVTQQVAGNYIGYGMSADISHRVNIPEYRDNPKYKSALHRSAYETRAGISSTLSYPALTLAWQPETPKRFRVRGEIADLRDMTVADGHRMGKRNHVFPVGFTDRRLYVNTIEQGFAKTLGGIGRLAMHHTEGQYLNTGEVLSFHLMLHDTLVHTDGDAEVLAEGTDERIWQSNVPYLALSMLALTEETV